MPVTNASEKNCFYAVLLNTFTARTVWMVSTVS